MYDSAGKSLEASVVFEYSIRYLKKCIYQGIEKTFLEFQNEDIEYVFTVPDVLGEKATLLMRGAAIKVLHLTLCKNSSRYIYDHMLCFNKLFKNYFKT